MALNCYIILSDNTRIAFDDDSIIANSVSITMSTCDRRRFDIGTFNAAILEIGIVDDAAANHNFAGAKIQLSETYIDEEGDEVSVDLGEYWVDTQSIERNMTNVKMKARDATVSFDAALPDNTRNTEYTALTALQAACAACDISLQNAGLDGYPNTAVTFKLSSAAIQTWRDVVMWVAQLVAANAIVNRNGMLELRPAWYDYDAPAGLACTAADRTKISFSDIRVWVQEMTAYSAGKVKTYTSLHSLPSGSQPGLMSLQQNPLLTDKSEADCDTINAAILDKNFLGRQITARLFSSAVVQLSDYCDFSGGKVDVRSQIRGKATHIVWRYHGYTELTCTAPAAMDKEGASDDS